MKKWFNKGVKYYLKMRYQRIEAIRKDPIVIQNQVLQSLLRRASKTEYGKKYDFSNVTNVSKK